MGVAVHALRGDEGSKPFSLLKCEVYGETSPPRVVGAAGSVAGNTMLLGVAAAPVMGGSRLVMFGF